MVLIGASIQKYLSVILEDIVMYYVTVCNLEETNSPMT